MPDNEKQFEQDIESFLTSPVGGWQKASDAGLPGLHGLRHGPGPGHPGELYPGHPAHPVATVREAVQLRSGEEVLQGP